jgi:hypothetical protein
LLSRANSGSCNCALLSCESECLHQLLPLPLPRAPLEAESAAAADDDDDDDANVESGGHASGSSG